MTDPPPHPVEAAPTLAALVERAAPSPVTGGEVSQLRDWLDRELLEATGGWDRPDGELRLTKNRIRRAQVCTAQLAGGHGSGMNEHLALGRVVDVAATALSVSPNAPHEVNEAGDRSVGSWSRAIAAPVRALDPELDDWYRALSPPQRLEHDDLVEARCAALKPVIGDLRAWTVISQGAMLVDLAGGVVLSTRPDLVILGDERVVVEIKSGSRFGLDDELVFYALVDALHAGRAAAAVVGVSLLPVPQARALPVDHDLLERAATGVVAAVRRCRDVDEAVTVGRWPPTSPGSHCARCDLAERCPSIGDEALDEWRRRRQADLDEDLAGYEAEPW